MPKDEAGIAICFAVDVRVCNTGNWLAFLDRHSLSSLEYSTVCNCLLHQHVRFENIEMMFRDQMYGQISDQKENLGRLQ